MPINYPNSRIPKEKNEEHQTPYLPFCQPLSAGTAFDLPAAFNGKLSIILKYNKDAKR